MSPHTSLVSTQSKVFASWVTHWQAEVHRGALDLVRRHARSPEQRAALERVVARLRLDSRDPRPPPTLHQLPLLVYAATGGDEARALPLAVAFALLGRGVDIQDDLADGDEPADGQRTTGAILNQTAGELFAALPILALAETDAPPAIVLAMQRTLARGFLEVSAGQRHDLGLAGAASITSEEVEACASAKAGAFIEIPTTLAAQLADLSPDMVAHYAAFGRALGIAVSLAEDCRDLFLAEISRDLRSGIRSYPVASHLERLAEQERPAFLELLERARHHDVAHAAVRQRLLASGTLLRCQLAIAVNCEEARAALDEAQPLEPARAALHTLIDSFLFK